MEDKEPKIEVHIDPLALLGVAFVIMKLCGVIDWGWFWVLLPLILVAL